jgi:enoyl-CoA hydratase/carnithine racemase
MMSSYETLRFDQADEIVTVTLNRPKLNLFNQKMVEELLQVWHSLRNNIKARFVVLTAQGDHFSAGADLKEIGETEITAVDARRLQLAGHEMMRSHYLVPETNIGTYYTWGCTPRLVRMVGASKAMEIIMTCDPIPAREAHRLNLANKVVPSDTLMEATHEFVAKIASKSPTCIRITKKIALGASMQGFGNMFICEPELMQEVVYTGETQKGIEAFMQKRPPEF